LEEVRNAAPILSEHRLRVGPRHDPVAFEHNRLMPGTRDSKRGRQPCHSSARDDEPHSRPSLNRPRRTRSERITPHSVDAIRPSRHGVGVPFSLDDLVSLEGLS